MLAQRATADCWLSHPVVKARAGFATEREDCQSFGVGTALSRPIREESFEDTGLRSLGRQNSACIQHCNDLAATARLCGPEIC